MPLLDYLDQGSFMNSVQISFSTSVGDCLVFSVGVGPQIETRRQCSIFSKIDMPIILSPHPGRMRIPPKCGNSLEESGIKWGINDFNSNLDWPWVLLRLNFTHLRQPLKRQIQIPCCAPPQHFTALITAGKDTLPCSSAKICSTEYRKKTFGCNLRVPCSWLTFLITPFNSIPKIN